MSRCVFRCYSKLVLMFMCVRYEWLGRKHKVSSSASRFSRYAEEKGLFSVKSVALKDNQVSTAGPFSFD